MTDPLEIKPFAVIREEPASRPWFLSPYLHSRTILLDDAPLEPQFTMDRVEAEDLIARLKPFYPKAKFEIVEVRSIDPAAMSLRYDASLPNRPPQKHANQNYCPKLAARTFADYHFDKRRQPLIVERKQRRSKVSEPEPQGFNNALIRQIMEMVELRGDRRDGCYASSFRVQGYSADIVREHLDFLVSWGFLDITPGPAGAQGALARYQITDEGADWLYSVQGHDAA
ncbi:hypothetical protein [Hyphomicrobium sp. 2TAF46]|uniref:hypothetical protein n=1 Tax=Hyphomicrobium sp. 2TAF46 TaxID=3233019 RepID=UPI003F8F986D